MGSRSDDACLIESSLVDPSAFAEIYDRHASALLRYLIRRVGQSHGEALLSDLFHAAFEARSRYDLERSDARPWLYGIAANLVMKHIRTEGRHRTALARIASRPDHVTPSVEEQVADRAATMQLWSQITEAIDGLPGRDREVVLLYAWEDLTYAEIAQALNIPVGTVRSRLNRVRAMLRELRASSEDRSDMPVQPSDGGAAR